MRLDAVRTRPLAAFTSFVVTLVVLILVHLHQLFYEFIVLLHAHLVDRLERALVVLGHDQVGLLHLLHIEKD